MYKLVLLRHGESQWNLENRFTGWTDVELSETGVKEATEAGRVLDAEGFKFDIAYTSVLKRAIKTLWLALEQLDQMWIPIINDWRLNERHYGALQGLDKAETSKIHGEKQVKIWRRSYDTPPPELDTDDPRFPGKDRRYESLTADELPKTESLKLTVDRFVPYFLETIVPVIKSGKRVIITAHGNSLRALVKYLDGISDEKIVSLNIPTGIPLLYELDENLKPISHRYLGDANKIAGKIQAVADQAKKKG